MSKIFLNFVEIKFILIKSSALDEGQINMFIMNTQLVLDFGKLSHGSPGPWLYLDLKHARYDTVREFNMDLNRTTTIVHPKAFLLFVSQMCLV